MEKAMSFIVKAPGGSGFMLNPNYNQSFIPKSGTFFPYEMAQQRKARRMQIAKMAQERYEKWRAEQEGGYDHRASDFAVEALPPSAAASEQSPHTDVRTFLANLM
jgi:hypothetical protein